MFKKRLAISISWLIYISYCECTEPVKLPIFFSNGSKPGLLLSLLTHSSPAQKPQGPHTWYTSGKRFPEVLTGER